MANKCWCVDAGYDQCPALESIHHIALHCKQATWVWEKLGLANIAASTNTLSQFVSITDETAASKLGQFVLLHAYTGKQEMIGCLTANILGDMPSSISLPRSWSNRSTKLQPQLIFWADKLVPE
jgi:hypothetical protein